MAKEPVEKVEKVEAPVKENKKAVKYFKNCTHAGAGIHLGFRVEGDPTTEEIVSFTKYAFRVRGDDVIEGYLATDDVKAIKRLEEDRYAEEIDKTEYDKALKDGRQVV